MITVPKRARRALIASAATGLAIALAAPAASALADGHGATASQSQGKQGKHVGQAPTPKAHKSHLKVTG
ncbi:MAG TPA: hypothetical protein VEV45_11520 [Streptosporangiaceae bacterium]|nr:hypothetical protein [Streptosporangiaceae bacterium]